MDRFVLLLFVCSTLAWVPYKDEVFYQDEASIFTPLGTQVFNLFLKRKIIF
jgi:hypothetical protein